MSAAFNIAKSMRQFLASFRTLIIWISVAMVSVVLFFACSAAAEEPRIMPAPVINAVPDGPADAQVAVLAGGCFWGVQGVYQHVKGVSSAVSGYSGGSAQTARYEIVGSGSTGHAEAVQITFDPRQISYGEILQVFFSVVNDPTQLNRQGPDTGTQYRSVIFTTNPEQAKVASAYISQLQKAGVFGAPIVTKVDALRAFYPAEDYHQDFLQRHPTNPYIVFNDLPKVANLEQVFPSLYRPDPTLVAKDGLK